MPFNSTYYAVLYPQNGDRIVTMDSVTLLRLTYCSINEAVCSLVDPADRDPLWRLRDLVERTPQDLYRLLDVVVNDLAVKVMLVRLLEQLALVQQPRQTRVLSSKRIKQLNSVKL